MSTDIKPLSRQDEIQRALAKHGLRMEHSLAVFDGGGHAIMSIATGERVGDEDLSPEVIALAEEWTVLEGPEVGGEDEAIANRIASRVLPPVPDRLTFHVWHDGDSSVGLPGDRSTVEIDLRNYGQEDRRDYIEQVREALQSSFGAIWDTRPKAMTADEISAEEALFDGGSRAAARVASERELVFTLGTGDGWNCLTDDGLGIRLDPVAGGAAWDWSATRAWWNGVGTGQAESREAAVTAASKCLTDAGLSLNDLPARGGRAAATHADASARWQRGDTAKFGRNNEREVQVFAGLFRYSGFGMGNYYSASQTVEWIDTTEAQRRAKQEGVRFVYWDAEQRFDPAGYEVQTGDKYISMPERNFQWWRDQQSAWHKVATALQDHSSSRVLDRGVDGAVECIKMLAKEATAYRSLGGEPGRGVMLPVMTSPKALMPGAYWYVKPGAEPAICEKREDEDFVRFTNGGRQSWVREGDRFVGPLGAALQMHSADPASAPMPNGAAMLEQAISQAGTERSPNTINIHACGPDGETVSVGTRCSSDVQRDLRIMDGAVELVHAIDRGVDIDAAALYGHLVGNGRKPVDGRPVRGFVLAFPGSSEAESDELVETLRMGGNTVYRVGDETAGLVLREVAASAGLDAEDLEP